MEDVSAPDPACSAPSSASPSGGSGSKDVLNHPPKFAELIEQSRTHVDTLALGHGLWLDKVDQWDFDQYAGEVTFVCSIQMTAVATVQIIGTFNTADNTWLWSCDNPSINKPLTEHARAVCKHALQNGVAALTERK